MTTSGEHASVDELRAELRASQARMTSMMAVASDLMLILSAEGEYLEVTAPDPSALIAPAKVLVGSSIHQQLPTPAANVVQAVIDRALAGGLHQLEYELPVADGIRTFHARVVEVSHPHGPAVLWCAREITAQKRAEQERLEFLARVQKGQKLESLGVLASGIAHDFNNMLTGVLANVGLVHRHLPPGSQAEEDLHGIEVAAHRAAELCRQLLAYAGRAQRVVVPLDLSELVQEIPELLKASISKQADLILDLASGLPPVRGDGAQVRQVVMNLVTNASEAITEDGTIRITTRAMVRTSQELARTLLEPAPQPGTFVEVVVSDDGAGMTPATVRRMFDPFFTTKFTGRGLGLASVLGIVRAHSGALMVESAPARGTSITVLLPATPAAEGADPEDAGRTPEPSVVPGQRVLVADDDTSVRRVAAATLAEAGYDVLTAVDGLEAVDLFRAHHAELSCVLLDQTMPRLDGEGTISELKQIDPKVPIVFMSGFAEQDVLERIPVDIRPQGFLAKPFTFDGLLEQIDRVARRP